MVFRIISSDCAEESLPTSAEKSSVITKDIVTGCWTAAHPSISGAGPQGWKTLDFLSCLVYLYLRMYSFKIKAVVRATPQN